MSGGKKFFVMDNKISEISYRDPKHLILIIHIHPLIQQYQP